MGSVFSHPTPTKYRWRFSKFIQNGLLYILCYVMLFYLVWFGFVLFGTMIGENRQLDTNEPVEFEK